MEGRGSRFKKDKACGEVVLKFVTNRLNSLKVTTGSLLGEFATNISSN
jgi:hypothetical protein